MRQGSPTVWLRAMPWVFVWIWSTGFIVARYGMPHAPPLSFLALRYALSILCFLPWIMWSHVSWPAQGRQWLHLAVTGVLMHGLYLGGVWSAVKLGMGSGLSALVIGLQPVVVALWISFQGMALGSRMWTGLLLGFAGLALVVSEKVGAGGEATLLNMSMVVVSLLSMSAGTLYQKRFVAPCDVRTANVVQLAAALALTAPWAWILETEPLRWNIELGGAMAWSVLALTLGGSSLLYLLLQRGAAASVSSLMYLVPPVTAVMAWMIFSEPITVPVLAGTALAAYGVSLVVRQPATALSRGNP
jgi:drug/metabolite transporter (DMT)-like permease